MKFSKKQMLFSVAAVGIGALVLDQSKVLDRETEEPAASHVSRTIVETPKETQAQFADSTVVEFTPSEDIQLRLQAVYAALSDIEGEYSAYLEQGRAEAAVSLDQAQAGEMLARVEALNNELNGVNTQLLEAFVEFVDAYAEDGFVLVDFYDEGCGNCQELDQNLAAGVALSAHSDLRVIKAETVKYDALGVFKRTGSYPELQLLRVSDFQLMGVSQGAVSPQEMADFIDKAAVGGYLDADPAHDGAAAPGF